MSEKIAYKIRGKSLINNKNTLETLYILKKFPVFIGCTDQDKSKDLMADIHFDICKETGFIQLKKLLPLDLIYSQYHSEAVGGVWKKHHEEFVNFLCKLGASKIFEIGGSNAEIAKLYLGLNKGSGWTILEPNPAYSGDSRINMIKGFFDEKFYFKDAVGTFVHSHVIEHLYEPFECLKLINNFLNVGALHVFSVPNLEIWLKKKFPNTLNFEHTVFLTEYFLDNILPLYGFEIIKKHYFEEHSIFYATKKVGNVDISRNLNLENKYENYKKLFMNFIEYHRNTVKDLNNKINDFDGDIYLFGAHIFSQMLIYFGLNTGKIIKILDDSELKQGKRLYGSDLIVGRPNELAEKQKSMVIVKAGSYTLDISNRLKNLNKRIVILN